MCRSKAWGILFLCHLSLFSNPAFSQDFGKLFTTPEERGYLDGLRENFLQRSKLEGFNIGEEARPWLEEELPAENVDFQMAGVMKRNNGGKAVWLNGKAVNEQDLPRNVKLVEIEGQQVLQIRANAKTYYLKSGQTLDIDTGKVRESFEAKPKAQTNNIAESIKDVFTDDEKESNEGSTKKEGVESVGINDLIEALQVIQETKNAN